MKCKTLEVTETDWNQKKGMKNEIHFQRHWWFCSLESKQWKSTEPLGQQSVAGTSRPGQKCSRVVLWVCQQTERNQKAESTQIVGHDKALTLFALQMWKHPCKTSVLMVTTIFFWSNFHLCFTWKHEKVNWIMSKDGPLLGAWWTTCQLANVEMWHVLMAQLEGSENGGFDQTFECFLRWWHPPPPSGSCFTSCLTRSVKRLSSTHRLAKGEVFGCSLSCFRHIGWRFTAMINVLIFSLSILKRTSRVIIRQSEGDGVPEPWYGVYWWSVVHHSPRFARLPQRPFCEYQKNFEGRIETTTTPT